MVSRIEWVAANCRLLGAIAGEFATTRPFDGITIGTGIHLEPKTVALLFTLQAGSARVVATGNLNSTQPESVAALRDHGVEVVGSPTTDEGEHAASLDLVLRERPALLLDNGGDLFARWVEHPYPELLGGTEETTSGRLRLTPMRDEIARPLLVVNDSPIKQFAENRHAVGQSVLESFLRLTNRSTNGRRVTVFGYGSCGKGVAATFRNACAVVSVVDPDPVALLEASMDGHLVPERDEAVRSADLLVTVTGAEAVITAADLALLKDGAVLANAGHFPHEIGVDAMLSDPQVLGVRESADAVRTLTLQGGRDVHLLAGGHMVNLAGPRPLGNSIESMDLGFSLQARCLEAIAAGRVPKDAVVVPVPREIDELVAASYLEILRRG